MGFEVITDDQLQALALLTDGNDRPDRRAAETAMVALVYEAGPSALPWATMRCGRVPTGARAITV